MKTKVARKQIDLRQYKDRLETLLGSTYTVMRGIKRRVQTDGARATLVLPEGEYSKMLRAAQIMREEGIAEPILLGSEEVVHARIRDLGLEKELKDVKIVRPSASPLREEYAKIFAERRARKGVTLALARTLMKQPNYFGAMMVEQGHADGLLNGISQSYPETLKPALQVIGAKPGSRLAGIYLMVFKHRVLWFADTTVTIEPSAEELADVAVQTAAFAQAFTGQEPRVAMLSFSNFGSNDHPHAQRARRAVELARARNPQLIIDGEMQADTALAPEISKESFPFNRVPGDANVLIFPDLQSGNIAYKMASKLGMADAIGPILVGMNKPVFVLQQNSDVNDVVNMASIAAMEIMNRRKGKA
jgi:malate dehydrogenase (oxaloacetate-decarboxylating)(NADP+)